MVCGSDIQKITTMIHKNTDKRPHTSYRTELILCLLLTTILASLYLQTGSYDFVDFDDNLYVTQNKMVQSGITLESIRWAFSINEQLYWHPLTWLSHMLDCQLYGLNPGMHHITNLILHILNCILLFLTLRGMTGSIWCSAFVALLFGIHPINVESVAWISSRKNVLSTFFWLLTMASYIQYCHKPSRKRYWITLICFVFGLMAKPMLVTLPFTLLLLDYWPLNRIALPDKWRVPPSNKLLVDKSLGDRQDCTLLNAIFEKIPFLLFSGLAIIFSTLAVNQLGLEVSFQSVPLNTRLSNALISYWAYIWQILWPTDLAFFYPFPKTIPLWKSLIAAFFLIVSTGLGVKFVRQAPYFLIGWLWYLGTLVPVIGIVQAGLWPATSDRFAYVPSIGLFLITVWSIRASAYKWQWLTPIKSGTLAAVVATTLFMATNHQIKTWQNSTALFKNAIANTQNNFLAYNNLGNVYLTEGDVDKSIVQYRYALAANPRYAEAHNNLAAALLKQNQIESAIEHLKIAAELNPANVGYLTNYNQVRSLWHYQKGITAMEEQGYDEALMHFDQALEFNKIFPPAIIMKARVLEKKEDFTRAIKSYKQFLSFDPANSDVPLQIASLYAIQGDAEQSAEWLHRSILKGFDDWDSINGKTSFINIKDCQPFRELMNRYDGLNFGE